MQVDIKITGAQGEGKTRLANLLHQLLEENGATHYTIKTSHAPEAGIWETEHQQPKTQKVKYV